MYRINYLHPDAPLAPQDWGELDSNLQILLFVSFFAAPYVAILNPTDFAIQ